MRTRNSPGSGSRRILRPVRAVAATVCCSVLAACPPTQTTPTPANPSTFCFPDATGVPHNPGGPNVDGVVAGNPGDLGWTSGFRYEFVNGSTVPYASMQGIRHGSGLYLSFEVHSDVTLDAEDAVLLVFSPGGGAANDRRILIHPLFAGTGAAPGGAPRTVKYWTESGSWNNAGASFAIDPAWLKNNIRVTSVLPSGSSPGKWTVEVMIPINATPSTGLGTDTGINLPSSGAFGLYTNVIRVTTSGSTQSAAELPWPAAAKLSAMGTSADILSAEEFTPAPGLWGKGQVSGATACNGVFVDYAGITVSHPGGSSALQPREISTTVPNVFNAAVYNDAVDASGTYVVSQSVVARFLVATKGIPGPGDWMPVAGPTPATNIPAATSATLGTASLSTAPWSVPPGDAPGYLADPNRCVLVELHSQAAGTVFKRRSAWTNMKFVSTSSPFGDTAVIGTRGYRLPEGASEHVLLVNSFTYNTPREAGWRTQINGSQGPALRVGIRPERSARLHANVLPPDIRIPEVQRVVGHGGSPAVVDVVAGGLVTIIAEGGVRLRSSQSDSIDVGPEGVDVRRLRLAAKSLPLQARGEPPTRLGALTGAWSTAPDSTFVIGRSATLRVPQSATQLYLRVDAPRDLPARGAFQVQVVATPLADYMAQTNSLLGRDPRFEAVRLPVGSNLPTWITCAQRVTGRRIRIEGRVMDLVEDVGCYGVVVRRIGRGER